MTLVHPGPGTLLQRDGSANSWRPDIEGLRGLAVLLVVLYHARMPWAGGGYIGVDVFFVISGFLMTKLIVDQFEASAFSYLTFLNRRLRRLVPAATLMILVTLAVSSFVLGAVDLTNAAHSGLWALGFAANIFFWRSHGYFADQVPEPALLHTWSLGLEEQFYLLFPLTMVAVLRYLPKVRVAVLAVATVASFALCWALTRDHPSASFFLLPTRAWEFTLGALAFLRPCCGQTSQYVRNAVSWLGLASLLASVLAYSFASAFPGVAAALPAAGTALFIWARSDGQASAGRWVGCRALRATGTISYSLYLWHWPIFTLAGYYAGRDLEWGETAFALAAAVLAAVLSQRYVENRFRMVSGVDKLPASLAAVGWWAGGVCVLAVAALVTSGHSWRFNERYLQFERTAGEGKQYSAGCHRAARPDRIATVAACPLVTGEPAQPGLLLWGDSHANALSPVIKELALQHGTPVWQASLSSCPPLLGVQVARVPYAERCRVFNAQVMKWLAEGRVANVLLVGHWSAYLPAQPETRLARWMDTYSRPGDLREGDDAENRAALSLAVQHTLRELAATGVHTGLVQQIPVQAQHVPSMLALAQRRGKNTDILGVDLAQHRRVSATFDALLPRESSQLTLIDPAQSLCDAKVCPAARGDVALYIDSHHLSSNGARALRPLLLGLFAKP